MLCSVRIDKAPSNNREIMIPRTLPLQQFILHAEASPLGQEAELLSVFTGEQKKLKRGKTPDNSKEKKDRKRGR